MPITESCTLGCDHVLQLLYAEQLAGRRLPALAHALTTRIPRLPLQIEAEFKRFSKFIEPEVRIANFVGGISRKLNEDELKDPKTRPHIVIGTPGRLADLVDLKKLPLDDIKYFIVDECDKILDQPGASLRTVRPLQLVDAAPASSVFTGVATLVAAFSYRGMLNCRHAKCHPEDLDQVPQKDASHDVLCDHER